MTNKEDPKSQHNPFIQFMGLGAQMGGTIYFGHLLGVWLDEKYSIEGVSYEKIVTLVAVFLSMYHVITSVTRVKK